MKLCKNTRYLLCCSIFAAILLTNNYIIPQENIPKANVHNEREISKTGNNFFHRIEGSDRISNTLYKSKRNTAVKQSDFNYRLVSGDKEEILEFMERVWTSRKREVLNDTVLSNGIKYKTIKWNSLSNSASDLPEFEYQRVDSIGNVYTYYNNEDKLLYDFTKAAGDTFSSPYPGRFWKVNDDYRVIGFNDTLKAFDFELLDSYSQSWMTVTVIEKYGQTSLLGRSANDPAPIERTFWGAIIDNVTYGELLAFKNSSIDWKRYYPLNIGDLWKYSQPTMGFITTDIKQVIKDTVLYDGNIFKKIKTETFLSNTPSPLTYSYERLDSSGNIFEYDGNVKAIVLKYRLSAAVGDTFSFRQNSYYRIDWKYNVNDELLQRASNGLFITLKKFIVNHDLNFVKDLGLRYIGIEGSELKSLVGAVINGISYGDTARITSVQEDTPTPKDFALLQNYPNPFNPVTQIRYSLKNMGRIKLQVFNALGCKVKDLVNEVKPAGEYTVAFDGSKLPSGVYIYRIQCGSNIQSRKMTLMR
ncbi:MAG: T9SS type A sorting domain-containing protein [Bacteroidota bacterium]|nr:T9SS type A sorting domain-containing protein [Bacteroidota bacterium]